MPVYNEAKRAIYAGEMDLNLDDMRVILVMTNTTIDTQNDGIVNTANFTTLDEMDGAGYARQALANEAVNKDDANDRAEFDADDVAFGALSNGTRQIQGWLIHEHITNDASSVPLASADFSGPINPGGSSLTSTPTRSPRRWTTRWGN